jgi:O-antigen ligase
LSSAIVSPFIAWSGDLSVNKQFITKGIIFSQCIPIFMLLAYLLDIYTNGPRFIADPDLWNESSLTFRITYGSVFAYQGFTMNPNASIFPFLVSMLLIKKFEPKLLFTKLQYLSLAVIILLTLATNSRGNLVLLILMLAFCYISWRSLLPFGLLGIVIGVSGSFLGDGLFSYVVNAVDRKLSSGFVGRFEKWGQAYDLFYANPIFGLGHDGFREMVGRGVENGWLELLANYGVIGLFLFCWYFLFVFCFRRSALCVPVIAIFSVMMIFNSAFLWPGTLMVLVFVASRTKISGVEMDDNTFHHAPRAN